MKRLALQNKPVGALRMAYQTGPVWPEISLSSAEPTSSIYALTNPVGHFLLKVNAQRLEHSKCQLIIMADKSTLSCPIYIAVIIFV